jgi:Ulp1 family protease
MRDEEENKDSSTARGGSVTLRDSKQQRTTHVTAPESILPSTMLYGGFHQGKKFVWGDHPPPRGNSSIKQRKQFDIPKFLVGSAIKKNEIAMELPDAQRGSNEDSSFGGLAPATVARIPHTAGTLFDRGQQISQSRPKRQDVAHTDFYERFWNRMQSIIEQNSSSHAEIAEPLSFYNYHYDKARKLTTKANLLSDRTSAERRNAELKEIESSIERIRSIRLQPKRRDVYPYKRTIPLLAITATDLKQFDKLTSKPHVEPVFRHEASKVKLTGGDLARLAPGNWLNDEVINLYLRLLQERDTRIRSLPDADEYSKCHFFNSFFLSKLYKDAGCYEYASVRRWTAPGRLRAIGQSQTCILDCDKIFIPINQSNMHWTVAVVDLRNERFEYFDSLLGEDSECLEFLSRYIVDEFRDKRGEDRQDILEWKRLYPKNIPRQANGYDCGVFLTYFANYLALDAKLNVENMDDFRVVMMKQFHRMEVNIDKCD